MKDKGGIIIIGLAAALVITVVFMAATVYLTGMTLSVPLSFLKNDKLSEDGYFEIYSDSDYERFWNYVKNEKPDAKGRLYVDVYLNNISDYTNWCEIPPKNVFAVADTFKGVFDGNGHTIYGLYSDSDYGLVKYNKGIIKNIIFRDSLIMGGNSGAGICIQNQGIIENCSFLGDIVLSEGMEHPGRAGICLQNKGEIRNCYLKENMDWQDLPNGQIRILSEEESLRIQDFLTNGLYEYYYPSKHSGDGEGSFKYERAETTASKDTATIFRKDEEIHKANTDKLILQDEQTAGIIYRISCRRKVTLKELTFEVQEKEGGFVLEIGCGNSVLTINKIPWKYEQDNQTLWQLCTDALQQESLASWEHETYLLSYSYETKVAADRIILYHTQQDKAGFFYAVKDAVYQVMLPEQSLDENQFWLARAREYLQNAYFTGGGETSDTLTGMWEIAFQEICQDKAVDVGILWKNEIMGEILCKRVLRGESRLLSGEEIDGITELHIYNEDLSEVESFKDLENLTNLTELDMRLCSLTDISFVAGLKGLTKLSLDENDIEDITPLTELMNLTEVSFINNEISDISPLRNLNNLKKINIWGNEVSDLSPLSDKTELIALEAGFNQIEDISPLEGLINLEELSLISNLIQDFTTIQGMEKLWFLSVQANPVQNIGERILTPYLQTGKRDENLSREEISLLLKDDSSDMLLWWNTQGDLNQDSFADLAVLVLEPKNIWKVYVFLGNEQGILSYQDSVVIESWDFMVPGHIDGFETSICIVDNRVLVQCKDVLDFLYSNIYEWEGNILMPVYETMFNRHVIRNKSFEWRIKDMKTGIEQTYALVKDQEGHIHKLLVNDSRMNEEMEKVKDSWQQEIAEIRSNALGNAKLQDISSAMHLEGILWHETSPDAYVTDKTTEWVLREAAKTFLDDYVELPIPQYVSEDIKENCDTLAGISLPYGFYFGVSDGAPYVLCYDNCRDRGGEIVHQLYLMAPYDIEKYEGWGLNKIIYYNESTGRFNEV